MNNYKDFDVYQRAYKLAIQIHQLSYSLPKELQFDLADQVRRASRSIPSNIAEGYGRRKSTKDIQNFLTTTLGSNDEMLFTLNYETTSCCHSRENGNPCPSLISEEDLDSRFYGNDKKESFVIQGYLI